MKMAVIWPRSEVLHFGILHYDSGHEPQYSWNVRTSLICVIRLQVCLL